MKAGDGSLKSKSKSLRRSSLVISEEKYLICTSRHAFMFVLFFPITVIEPINNVLPRRYQPMTQYDLHCIVNQLFVEMSLLCLSTIK